MHIDGALQIIIAIIIIFGHLCTSYFIFKRLHYRQGENSLLTATPSEREPGIFEIVLKNITKDGADTHQTYLEICDSASLTFLRSPFYSE